MKNLIATLALTVGFCLLTSCNSTRITGQPELLSNLPGQFSYSELRANIVTMQCISGRNSSESDANQLAGKHVAKLCLQQGYRYFTVLEKSISWIEAPAGEGSTGVARVTGNVQFFNRRPDGAGTNVVDAQVADEVLFAF